MSVKNVVVPGIPVVKSAQNLPQTATANLFTVSGAVQVTALLGRVTTALGSTSAALSLGTPVSNSSIATNATSLASKAAGTWLVPQNASGIGGALIATDAPFVPADMTRVNPFIVSGNITWTTGASVTGQIEWYLWYIPIDNGAAVS